MLVGKIRFKSAGIVLILDLKSQPMVVLVIQDRRNINLKQKKRQLEKMLASSWQQERRMRYD